MPVRFVRLWSTRAVLGAAVVLAFVSSGTPLQAQPAPSSKTDDLVLLINRARVRGGVLPLARSGALDAAAQAHSVDMVQHKYLDHTGSDGSEPQDRADRAGYHVPPRSGWIVVEVISAISGEPTGPVDWWLNQSPEQHGKVLLNPRWREIGVGYAEGGEYGNYWTALFGCRPGVLPTVSLDGTSYTHTEECGDPGAGASMPTAAPTAMPTAAPSATPTATAALQVSPSAAMPGGLINAQWQGIARPSTTDWIGLYRFSDADASPIDWTYVGCSRTPLDARPLGSCNLLLPTTLAAGTYQVRLFSQNGYTRLAASTPLAVASFTRSVQSRPAS